MFTYHFDYFLLPATIPNTKLMPSVTELGLQQTMTLLSIYITMFDFITIPLLNISFEFHHLFVLCQTSMRL